MKRNFGRIIKSEAKIPALFFKRGFFIRGGLRGPKRPSPAKSSAKIKKMYQYYSEWFYNRIKEGYVYTRNPYNPKLIHSYQLNPSVVDILVFCTKNPEPMMKRLDEINHFKQFWGITLTAYGKDIEPNVLNKH